jgi:hypothetical protein
LFGNESGRSAGGWRQRSAGTHQVIEHGFDGFDPPLHDDVL